MPGPGSVQRARSAQDPSVHRFCVPAPLPAAGEYVLTGDAAHRVSRVLRMTPGERLRLFDGSGREVEGTVTALRAGEVSVALTGELPPEPPSPALHLYQGLIRPSRFEWLLEKATELGAVTVQPVLSERCQVRPAEFGKAKAARWGRILMEAAEQCGRRTLPVLGEPLSFDQALRAASGLIVMPWEELRDAAPPLGRALRERGAAQVRTPDGPPALSLFIGPEGGFSSREVQAARGRDALVVSLGPRVLRAETAAAAALAIAGDALRT